jgi:hypothetical protein
LADEVGKVVKANPRSIAFNVHRLKRQQNVFNVQINEENQVKANGNQENGIAEQYLVSLLWCDF